MKIETYPHTRIPNVKCTYLLKENSISFITLSAIAEKLNYVHIPTPYSTKFGKQS